MVVLQPDRIKRSYAIAQPMIEPCSGSLNVNINYGYVIRPRMPPVVLYLILCRVEHMI